MISIKTRIVGFVDYVEKTYKNEEAFFPDFQKSEDLKIQAEKIIENTRDDKFEVVINVKSSKEIDEIVYYLISNLLGDDLATLLNMVYSKPESGIVIFSKFQNIVAKIYEMNVVFNIKNGRKKSTEQF
ncbi:MAG: hypothetical protein SPK10_10575 [Treponema sp.]|nr:hypothetical protein [Treponema sp.]MDY5765227.1 hypothetical protein [Treponema sp.]